MCYFQNLSQVVSLTIISYSTTGQFGTFSLTEVLVNVARTSVKYLYRIGFLFSAVSRTLVLISVRKYVLNSKYKRLAKERRLGKEMSSLLMLSLASIYSRYH